uniref:Uncharacterized protein n=2 Tax=Ceratitis capitata TaxID=7213 RepID=W8B733_CERCA
MLPTKFEGQQINFLSERLNIPLLLATRNRFKDERIISNYVRSKRKFYKMNCALEKSKQTRTKNQARKLLGDYPRGIGACPSRRMAEAARYGHASSANQLPPNIYDTRYTPYESRRGMRGAYWKKLPKEFEVNFLEYIKFTPKPKERGKWRLYNVVVSKWTERFNKPCNRHKGVFLSNARLRRPTTRCMLTDPTLVYRPSTEPSPAHYNVASHTISHRLPRAKYTPKPNPHLFLPKSCVPEKLTSIIPRHLSFQPAVGRYEVRFPKHCACGKKIFTPGLPLLIDREKRKRFRLKPYKKIKAHLYCAPDFTHVPGHGHTYVFRLPGAKKHQPKPLEPPNKRKPMEKSIQQFHDYRYIKMIIEPRRRRLSDLPRYFQNLPKPKVRFNCIIKVAMRRQLTQGSRKLGFGGNARRFSNLDYRAAVLSVQQMQQIKSTLPPERRLRDQPVTRRPLTDIKSEVYAQPVPKHSTFEPMHRRAMKFPPLPGPKLLVTRKDLLPEMKPGIAYKPPVYYNKSIDIRDFLSPQSNLAHSTDDEEDD